ncbi:MAG: acyl-CoA desaturase, partial [Planctomyces sp.]
SETVLPAVGGDAPLATPALRTAYAVVIVVPLLALIAAIALLWGPGVQPVHLYLLVGGYILTGLGITIGFHRLFTHKAFTTSRFMTAFWAILGSMAAEGSLFIWCGVHRVHHQFSDTHADPHSPHAVSARAVAIAEAHAAKIDAHRKASAIAGTADASADLDHDHHHHDHDDHAPGFRGLVSGFWHAHAGWLFRAHPADMERYIPDLRNDPVLRFVDRFFFLWLAVGLLIPGVIAGLVTQTWTGAALGVLWGGLVRILVVHHITRSINSACHLWGARDYVSHDHSRNNLIFGILGLGEGWHNNHHAFPTSARHGLAWWQFDLSWIIIRGMELVGLARNVRLPSPERLAAKRRTA